MLDSTPVSPPIPPDAHDGAIVSTKFHKVIYEDQDVRVLDVINPPHTMEEMHTHVRAAAFIVLEDHPYVIHYLGDKPIRPAVGHTPYVVYFKPTPMHAIENSGDYTIHAVRIKLKHPGCGPTPVPLNPPDALTADAAHTKLALETEDVRILEITLPPHSREEMHTDAWPAITYVDQPAQVRYFTPDHPPSVQHASPTGVVRIQPEGLHAAENLSDTPSTCSALNSNTPCKTRPEPSHRPSIGDKSPMRSEKALSAVRKPQPSGSSRTPGNPEVPSSQPHARISAVVASRHPLGIPAFVFSHPAQENAQDGAPSCCA